MLRNYIKIAWKVLGRNKFFTFVSLFGISFTLAVLIIIIAFLNQILGSSYPETNSNKCLYINRVIMDHTNGNNMMSSHSSFHLLKDYIEKLKTPETVAIASNIVQTNTFVGNRKLRLGLRYTDADFWKVFEFEFLSGSAYHDNHVTKGEYVAVISNSAQEAYFGEEVDVIGKTITTDNTNYRVIGVVRDVADYQMNSNADIYVPYSTSKDDLKAREYLGSYAGIILAKSPADFPAIKAELKEMIAKIPIPKDENYNRLRAWAQTRGEYFAAALLPGNRTDDDDPPVGILYLLIAGAMLLFMMLPTLNLININTSRIMERASEIGIRKAFGASTSTLTVQFIIENIILTFIGGAIGLIIAFVALNIIENSGIIPHAELNINYKVFLAAIALCLIFGFLSGVLPAFRMSRLQVVQAIKGGEG